nr:uncharacterized protein LOC117280482 isoform X2 [Nicotiana tomentosiformis]
MAILSNTLITYSELPTCPPWMSPWHTVASLNLECMASQVVGKLWKLHAWADEGECPAEQESLVRIVDARTIQLQRTGGYLPQRFPRK